MMSFYEHLVEHILFDFFFSQTLVEAKNVLCIVCEYFEITSRVLWDKVTILEGIHMLKPSVRV